MRKIWWNLFKTRWNCIYTWENSKDIHSWNSLFGTVKLVKNADIDKWKYSGYGTGFDMKGTFSFPTGGFGKNVIIFGADLSSSVHVGNKRKDVLILVEGLTQGLDDTTLTTRKYFVKIIVELILILNMITHSL